MSTIKPSAGLRSKGGFVLPVTFSYDKQPYAELAGAYSLLNSMADALAAKREELETDRNLSDFGRNEQFKAFLRGPAVDALKRASRALEMASDQAAEIGATMTLKGYDKTDLAAAIMRSEIRAHLRGLPPERKVAMAAMGEVDAQTLHAILEAPAELSGVTPEQHQKFRFDAIAKEHPDKAQQLADIDGASSVLKTAITAAASLVLDRNHIAGHELDGLVGGRRRLSMITKEGTALPMAAE